MSKSSKKLLPWFYRAKIPKKYDPGEHLPGFEKPKFCRAVAKEKIRVVGEWLGDQNALEDFAYGWRHPSPKPKWTPGRKRLEKFRRVVALYERLSSCSPKNPCASRACAVCSRKHRRAFVSLAMQVSAGRPIKFLTWCPMRVPVGDHMPDWQESMRLKNAFRQHLLRASKKHGVDLIVMGRLDGKVTTEGGIEPHFHAVAMGASAAMLRKIKPKSAATGVRKRGRGAPWVIESVYPKGRWKVLSYIVRQRPKTGEVGDWKIKLQQRGLRRDRDVENEVNRLLFLDSVSFEQAMIYLGCEMKNGINIRVNVPPPLKLQIKLEKLAHFLELKKAEDARRKRAAKGQGVRRLDVYRKRQVSGRNSALEPLVVDDDDLEELA